MNRRTSFQRVGSPYPYRGCTTGTGGKLHELHGGCTLAARGVARLGGGHATTYRCTCDVKQYEL
jgi:hypothetical protein